MKASNSMPVSQRAAAVPWSLLLGVMAPLQHEWGVKGRALASLPQTEGPGTAALLRKFLAVGWY